MMNNLKDLLNPKKYNHLISIDNQENVDLNIVKISKKKDDLYPFFSPGSDEVVAPGIKNNNKNIEP